MRMLGVSLVAGVMATLSALAQVSVEVMLDQEQFLAGEALPLAVRISNRSGQTLRLGGDDDWLSVSVETRDHGVVSKLGDPPVRGEFTLESSQRATRRVDIAPYFNLGRQGAYRAQVTVKIAQWNQQFSSTPVSFDIITGARVWEREFGVPQPETNTPPEVRKYTLMQANYLKKGLKLYLRITDAEEAKVFRVFALGPVVSFAQPEAQIDPRCNLHVLCQTGRTTYSYTVANPDGDVLVRQTHEISGNRPRLQVGEHGKVAVVGGARRYADDDFPPREPFAKPAEAALLPPPAAVTNTLDTAKP
ncbi:MAG TPA: hypothetical protein VI136_14215 [Verrucomicrobiae bacterium]